MKITLAKVTGFALLVASFACSGSLVYADTDTSPAMQTFAVDADTDGSESVAILDCDTEDGMGACPVDASLADGGQTSPASIEPPTTQTAATENSEAPVTQALATETQAVEEPAAPTIHSVDAIIAEVTQSVTVAAPGQDIASNEDLTYTGSITDPAATESDSTIDAASLDDLE